MVVAKVKSREREKNEYFHARAGGEQQFFSVHDATISPVCTFLCTINIFAAEDETSSNGVFSTFPKSKFKEPQINVEATLTTKNVPNTPSTCRNRRTPDFDQPQ